MSRFALLNRSSLAFVALLLFCRTSTSDETENSQPTPPTTAQTASISEVARRLHDAKAKATESDSIGERIRESTWRLLLGETASHSDLKMFSAAYDASRDGLEELNEIDDELKASEDLQRQVAASPQLAMRLDLALSGRQATEKNVALSREQELLRLNQLREINREYRALIEDLLASQTEILLGNSDELNARLKSASEHLKQVEGVVAAREDFYLFADEPKVEDHGNDELKIVTTMASPYSESTLLHQKLVSAYAQLRASLGMNPIDRNGLQACLTKLSEITPGEAGENALFDYIRGVANMEIGASIVGDRVWNPDAHKEASQNFADAKDSLSKALSRLDDKPAHQSQRDDIKSRLLVLDDKDEVLLQARRFAVQDKNESRSLALLEKGIRTHASPQIFLAWVNTRWEIGDLDGPAAINLIKNAEDSALLDPADEIVVLIRNRITALDAWNQFQNADVTENVQENLGDAKMNLRKLVNADDIEMRLESSSIVALLDVMLLTINDANTETAKVTFSKIGTTAAELESRLNQAAPDAQSRLAGAAAIARLAEGYLAVRFEPSDSNRAQLAFAAAAEIGGTTHRMPVQPLPNAAILLRAMLTRDDAANLRLALRERQLRMAIQKSIPAVIATSLDSTVETTASLVRDAEELMAAGSGGVLQPSSQLDPRELATSQETVAHDTASVAAFALLKSKRPIEALRLLLKSIDYPLDPAKDMSAVSWNEVIQKLDVDADLLMQCAFAESLEFYAADQIENNNPQKPVLLKQALASQQRVAAILNSEKLWKEKWPFLEGRAQASIGRLTDASQFLKNAQAFRTNMELASARKQLQDGTARFPNNTELRIELVQTLLDESEMNSTDRERLLNEGVAVLKELPPDELNSTALIMLAELHEHLGNSSEAISTYQNAVAVATTLQHSLIARSRISSLRLSVASN